MHRRDWLLCVCNNGAFILHYFTLTWENKIFVFCVSSFLNRIPHQGLENLIGKKQIFFDMLIHVIFPGLHIVDAAQNIY